MVKQVIKKYVNPADVVNTFSFMWPFIKKYRMAYGVLLLLMIVDLCITIGFARFFGSMIEAAVHGDFIRLKSLMVLCAVLVFAGMATNFFRIYCETAAASGVKKELKDHLFNHVLRLPAGTAADKHSGELLSHFSNDIHSIDGLIGSNLIDLVRLPFIFLTVFIYLFHLNAMLSLLSLVIAPVAAAGGVVFGLFLRRNSRFILELTAQMQSLLSETFQGFALVKSFTMEKLLFTKYIRKNRELFQLELANAKLQGSFYSAGQLVSSATFYISLCLGAYFVTKGMMAVGTLLTFVNLVHHLVYPLSGLASQWAGFQRSTVALQRIIKVLEQPSESANMPSFVSSGTISGSIEMRDISFRYVESQPLFDHFHLRIPQGKVVALVGRSGAGKSTLFHLLQGLYRPQYGEILIDHVPADRLTLSQWRSSIAHVPQETFLFSGSIRENLLCARPKISDSEMKKAAVEANIHDFIMSLPNQYETEIGERGIKLSGGQKQRIAIARAILKDTPILLLDEATSALDSESEFRVKTALARLMRGRTTLIIAHRLSTIRNADLIIVLDQGKIVQTGNHEVLMNQEGLYRQFHNEAFFEQKETGSLSLVSRP